MLISTTASISLRILSSGAKLAAEMGLFSGCRTKIIKLSDQITLTPDKYSPEEEVHLALKLG